MFDIPAIAYHYIYLFLVFVLTIGVLKKYRTTTYLITNKNSAKDEVGSLFLIFFLAIFIGFRPLSGKVFVDMVNYAEYYTYLEGTPASFDLSVENIFFDNLFAWWAAMHLGYTSFFFLIACIYFGATYLGIRRLFPHDTMIAYLVFLAAFSTFSYATNGIKAGAAASLFIWAMGYRNNLKICIPLILLSYGFHHSMQLPVVAFVLTTLFKHPKWYYYAWIFCFLMAALHITYFQNLFGGMTDEQGAGYLNTVAGDDATKGGFRIDFILYSAMPVWLGYLIEMKKKIPVSDFYRSLIHLYVCCNGIWMLCMYASFTNRIAYLSWFLYPVVLIYPYLRENIRGYRLMPFKNVVMLHLSFTLFMDLIYYGGLATLFGF